jgi:long-chain fatty acid transport protein
MNRQSLFTALGFLAAFHAYAADVYGTAATAHTIALGGIYLGSSGATDALAFNPAMLTSIDRPYLEFTGMGVLAAGQFHNSTPYVGTLRSNSGLAGSAAFGMHIPHSRLSMGLGVFPVSLLSDQWRFQDPPGTAGASYGVRTNKSAFIALQASAGVAFQVSRRLSLGASFGVVDNLNTLETPYIFQTNPTLAGLKTLLDLHTGGLGYNGTFGLIAQPIRSLKLSLAYKTRTTVRSTGSASGNAYAQFAALDLPYASTFHYKAEVDNVFPQSVSAGLGWQTRPRLQTYLQVDWLNWHGAFVQLPVHLTQGDNTLLNSLLGSTTLNDSVPLHWRNQLTVRTGFEFALGETFTLMGAYSYGNSPVPASTLTPLTAAIMTDGVSGGVAYQKSRYRVQLAYQVNLPQSGSVGTSGLLAGEYSNTRTSLWLQTIALTTGVRF